MKTIETNGNKYLALEVPKDAYGFSFKEDNNGKWNLNYSYDKGVHGRIIPYDGHIHSIINTLSSITEDECKGIVDKCFPFDHDMTMYFKDYVGYKFLKTAKESLISLLLSNGFDMTKEYLLIKINQ